MIENLVDSFNNVCEQLMIDPRFVLGCNFLLEFLLRGSKLTKNGKKVVSIGVMLAIAVFCWMFFDMSGQKLFFSIPTALVFYDYFLKSIIKKLKSYIDKDVSKEQNDDIDQLDAVG